MHNNKIVIASDHAGFTLKHKIIQHLTKLNLDIVDLGCDSEASVDYPDYAYKLAKYMKENVEYKGILLCGSGIGISIAANRFRHIRAALCVNPLMAKLSRSHNDANVLVLGERIIDHDDALECVDQFLFTEFEKERHQNRVNKLKEEGN